MNQLSLALAEILDMKCENCGQKEGGILGEKYK